jgi:hypothetical protein
MWQDGTELRATRTNRAATRVGPVATASPPPGTQTVWKVNGDGATGPLDLLASVETPEGIAVWHTQVLPILAVTASPTGFTAGDTARVTFTVTDAGDPVPGATIEVEVSDCQRCRRPRNCRSRQRPGRGRSARKPP